MFESPSKQKDQQIDVATLAVSRVGLNGSLFNRLRSECKLTHLHVRPLIGSRQNNRHFVSVDNFQRQELRLSVITRRDDAIRLLDSGGGQPYPLGSGWAFFNVALACDADRTCQQMRPNERHLRYSLEWLLAPQDQERTGGPLRAMRQRHLRPSPALRLTLQVMGTSDKTLSHTDILIEGPRLFVLQMNPKTGGACVSFFLSLIKRWGLHLFCGSDDCLTFSLPPGSSHTTQPSTTDFMALWTLSQLN